MFHKPRLKSNLLANELQNVNTWMISFEKPLKSKNTKNWKTLENVKNKQSYRRDNLLKHRSSKRLYLDKLGRVEMIIKSRKEKVAWWICKKRGNTKKYIERHVFELKNLVEMEQHWNKIAFSEMISTFCRQQINGPRRSRSTTYV